MGTTARTTTRPAARPRASGRENGLDEERLDEQYDLLTAALLGVALGVGATLLMRRGPRGRRPISTMARAAGRGARAAGRGGMRGARWAGEQAADLWERVPVDDIQEQVGDYLDAARNAIEDAVESELRDLRKAIRRQRKRLGL